MINKTAQTAYITSIMAANEIPAKYVPIVSTMLDMAYYNEDDKCMEIIVITYVKKKIAEKAKLKSTGPVNSAIHALEDAGILKCVDNGVLQFRQEFFGCYNWAEAIEVTLGYVYDKDGVSFFQSIDYGDGPIEMADYCDTGETEKIEVNEESETVSPQEKNMYDEGSSDPLLDEQTDTATDMPTAPDGDEGIAPMEKEHRYMRDFREKV